MSSFWVRPEMHNQYMASLAASMGGLSVGASVGWSSPAHHLLVDEKASGFAMSFHEFGWICGALWLGLAIPVGLLANCIGRKLTMVSIIGVVNIIGWIIIIFGSNLYHLILARFVHGLALGTYFIVAPLYHSELTATNAHRIVDRCLHEFFYTLGILSAFGFGAFREYHILCYGCALITIMFLLIFVWMPETPIYYMSHGKTKKALESIEWLRGKDTNPIIELSHLVEEIRLKRNRDEGLIESLKQSSTKKSIIIGICLAFIQHFTGSTPMITYATFLFIETETNDMDVYLCTIAFGIAMSLSVLLAMRMLNAMQPRTLLILSCIPVMILNSSLGLHCHLRRHKDTMFGHYTWLPIIGLCSFIFFHALGLGSVTYYLMCQLFRPEVKSFGFGLMCFMSGIFGCISVTSFTNMIDIWGQESIFFLYAVVSVLGLCFIYFDLRENENYADRED